MRFTSWTTLHHQSQYGHRIAAPIKRLRSNDLGVLLSFVGSRPVRADGASLGFGSSNDSSHDHTCGDSLDELCGIDQLRLG